MAGIFRLTYELDGVTQNVDVDEEQCLIGRSESCTVMIPAASVSRVHAKIVRDQRGWTIFDQQSRNGMYINRDKLKEARLQDNDIISLGLMELKFNIVEPPVDMAVVYSEGEYINDADISQSIGIENFRERLQGPPPSGATIISEGPLVADTDIGVQSGDAWAIRLFSRAAEALIKAVDLDEMFETVVTLAFENLPAQRGCIFQYDAQSGERQLKVMRQKSRERGEKFTISNTIIGKAIERKCAVLYDDTAKMDMSHSIATQNIRSILCAPLEHSGEVLGVIYLDTCDFVERFNRQHLEVLTTLAVLSAVAVHQAKLRDSITREQAIRQRLARYSAPGVVDRIVSSVADIGMKMLAEEREASVLFLDIVKFTTLSEDLSPLEVTQLLNSIFERLTECVFDQEGTLDKFTGDGLMAIFGAPLTQPDHALRAVRAAIQMQHRLNEFNRGHEQRIQIRIGINTGSVLAGDIGSERRRDYTVIGDTVNLASRLESQVAQPGGIVIGESTYRQIEGEFPADCLEYLGTTSVKGKLKQVQAYRVCWEKLPDTQPSTVLRRR